LILQVQLMPIQTHLVHFVLRAEDARTVSSIGGLDHHEIRWRKATLNEAKKVVLAYHKQLNLVTTPVLVVSSENGSGMIGMGNGQRDAFAGRTASAAEDKQDE
jgi:hypothetical protein